MAAAWEEAEQAGLSCSEPPRDEQAAPIPKEHTQETWGQESVLGSLSVGVRAVAL